MVLVARVEGSNPKLPRQKAVKIPSSYALFRLPSADRREGRVENWSLLPYKVAKS